VATDAPLLPHQCERLARRAGLGIGALGAFGGHYSGDLFVCFSTANRGLPAAHYCAPATVAARIEMLSNTFIDAFFEAVVEATQEAVLNALLQAETMAGRDGMTAHALDGPQLVEVLDRFGRRRFGV
jgi:D-aminopeptidase